MLIEVGRLRFGEEWDMIMYRWWNDNDWGKLKYWEKNIVQCGW